MPNPGPVSYRFASPKVSDNPPNIDSATQKCVSGKPVLSPFLLTRNPRDSATTSPSRVWVLLEINLAPRWHCGLHHSIPPRRRHLHQWLEVRALGSCFAAWFVVCCFYHKAIRRLGALVNLTSCSAQVTRTSCSPGIIFRIINVIPLLGSASLINWHVSLDTAYQDPNLE